MKWSCFAEPDARREQVEHELLAAGLPLPLTHRCAWARSRPQQRSWFLAIPDESHRYTVGFAIDVTPSRALPGHEILRIDRFGHALPPETHAAAVAALGELGRQRSRVLRIHVEAFQVDPAASDSLAAALHEGGFQRVRRPRRYTQTLRIDLTPDDPAILASLHATARRHMRAVAKHPVEVRPIEDPLFAERLTTLDRETRARTCGGVPGRDWTRILGLSRQHPTLSRVAGLFRQGVSGPDALLSYAWGCHHGDHAHYETAASTRCPELRLPLGYALVWDLLRWAKSHGATWFDFGGAGEMLAAGEERLAGILEFKRYFTDQVVSVGDEWILEPRWLRAKAARAVSAGVDCLHRIGAGSILNYLRRAQA